MPEVKRTLQPPLPLALGSWIALNVEFGVLLCARSGCDCVVSPGALSRHLYRKHQANIQVRWQGF
jgi:hypothetical protein